MKSLLLSTTLLLAAHVSPAALISHWTLDDPIGTDPVIDSASSFNASQTGSPILGISGVAGTAASFPAGANYFLTPGNAAFELSSYTFSLWFNPLESGGGNYNTLFSNRIGENGFILYQRNDGIEFWQRRTSGGWQAQIIGITRGVDEWLHIVGSFDATTGDKKFYVTPASALDATVDATLPGANILLSGGTPSIGIGVRGDGGLPQNGGYLDDIQLYDEALADFQVNFLFHNPGLTVPEPSRSLALIAGLGAVLLRRRR